MHIARVLSCVSFFSALLLAFSSTSHAFTLRAAPEATAQVTCPFCFLPVPISVQVVDRNGKPQRGVAVTFTVPPMNVVIPGAGPGPFTVSSNEDGYASPPAPGFAAISSDTSFSLDASAAGSNMQVFNVSVAGGGPVRMFSSADEPAKLVNATYPSDEGHIWAVAVDADGNYIPNAVVELALTDDRDQPSGRFAHGARSIFLQADANGFAYAPDVKANNIPGKVSIRASSLNPEIAPAFIDIFNSARGAAAIEVDPKSLPQSTRTTAIFPEPLAVVVRDKAGRPQSDIAVHFALMSVEGAVAFFQSSDGDARSEMSAMTGPDGRATARWVALALGDGGPLAVDITVPGGPGAVSTLNVLPGPMTRLEIVTGNHQRAFVNTQFAEPLVMRAIGADGMPVPYANIRTSVKNFPGLPGASFGLTNFQGVETAYLNADVNGFVTSPTMTANGIPGNGSGFVFLWVPGDPVFFTFLNLPMP